tara:strand:- start:32975 stop:33655 length:681 start_codon:yes stop_codon:yes gene_type:complete
MKFAIIVPARKGSKTIKDKNLFKINNKSLVEYTFSQIKNLNYQKFVLSDDFRILKKALKYKINTSYQRPPETSDSKSSMVKTLLHFVKWLKIYDDKISELIVLQPTSPLRVKKDVINAINIYKKKKFHSLFSISESLEHPYEAIDVKNLKNNSWKYVLKKSKMFYRRQDFDINSYFINGAIYIINIKKLEIGKSMVTKNHGLYLMNKFNSLDINDIEDIKVAKKLL